MVTKTFYYNEDEMFNDKIEEWMNKNIEKKGIFSTRCKKDYKITITIQEFKDEKVF